MTVGDRVAPPVIVMLGQSEQPRARYVFSTTNPAIARIFAGGDSVEITSRGAGSLIATLVGTTIGNNVIGGATPQTADTVVLVAASTSVIVNPNPAPNLTAFGATTTFTATVLNTSGQPIPGAPVAWSVPVGGTFVSIDPNTGVATALANGTATIRASSGGATSDVALTVAQAISTTRSTITPAPLSITADGASTSTITVQLRDANGNDIAFGGSTVNLFTSRGSMSSVTNIGAGRYTATLTSGTTAGSATITGTVNSVALSGSAVVSFTAGAAVRYLVNSSSFTPTAGTSVIISAQLADVNNNPVPTAGSVVAWSSTGGGSFSSGTSTTNASGIATVSFTTSVTPTPHTVTATTGGITGTSPTITPSSGVPTNYLVSPATTSPASGSAILITAQMRDANGNPVSLAGEIVTWTKSDPNGTFSAGGTSTTNGSGVATITLTTHTVAGTPTTVTATSAGPVAGTSPTITTVAGNATQLSITQAPSTNAQSGVPFPVQPAIQLLDANSNPVNQANLNVTATISAGGGAISGATTVQTDANGLATFTDLAISGANGARTLRFSTSGATPITAPVTIDAGTAAQIVPVSATSQSGTAGTTVASVPQVQVRDASNNPVANHPVTFAITSGGGVTAPISGTTVNTDIAGNATLTSWTLGTTAGTNAVTATAAGLAGSPISFIANGTPDVVSAGLSSLVRTGPDNVLANGMATSTLSVTLRDQYGNPVPGRVVSLDDAGSASTIMPVNATSNASGQATFTVANATPEIVTYTATANDPGAITITQTAQVTYGNSPATLLSIAPVSGNLGETLDVTFTGEGYEAGVSTVQFGPGITLNSTTVNSSTQITANISIPLGTATGARNVTVSNGPPGGGTSMAQTFTVTNPLPTLTSVVPAAAVRGQTNLQVIFTGTNFVPSSTVDFSGPGDITVNSVTVDSPTQITTVISVGALANLGVRNARVTTGGPGGGTSANVAFTVSVPAVPTLTSLAPNVADRLATLDVVLTGAGFANSVTTVNAPAGITLNSAIVNSPTQITANITIPAGATLGANNFTVTNTPAGGTSGAVALTVNNPAPTLTTVAPASGERLQTLNVVFTGTGFISGFSSVNVGADITVNSVIVDGPTQITANITIPATAATGARNISVSNASPGGGTSASQTFTVNNPAPTIANVTPNPVGAVAIGTTTIPSTTIDGTGFIAGVTQVTFDDGDVNINGTITVNSSNQITVTNIEYPATLLRAPTVTLRVTNPGRTSVTFTITL